MTPTGVASFDQAMSALQAALPGVTDDLDTAAASHVAAMLRVFAGFVSTVEATRLRLVAAAETTGAHRVVGARDTAALVADVCGQKVGTARRDADTALLLGSRPATADALASGQLSPAKAAALARLHDQAVTAEEAALVARAASQSVRQVEAAVEAANARHRAAPPPAVKPEATFSHEAERVQAQISLPAVDGEFFEKACVAAAEDLDLGADVPFAERLGRGAVAMARWYLGHRPDEAARPLRSRTVVGVHIGWDTLTSGEGSGTTYDGATFTADDVRRLACNAGISRIVTDPDSRIIDIGRAARTIPPALELFLTIEDQSCRWPGCTSPGWACEGHHVKHWTRHQGPTERDNIALLCWHHHHLVHTEPSWQLTLTPGSRTLTVRHHGQILGITEPPGRQQRLAARQRQRQQRPPQRRRQQQQQQPPQPQQRTSPVDGHQAAPPPGQTTLDQVA